MAPDHEHLVKIRVDLPDCAFAGGERLWAEPLGRGLFRVRSIPFYAKQINFLDVVQAASDAGAGLPVIRHVVEPGGHRTVRVCFTRRATADEVRQVLDELRHAHADFESMDERFYSVDIPPDANYAAICSWLWTQALEGILLYRE